MCKKKVNKKYFFEKILDNEIIYLVRNGYINPWIFFVSEKGFERLKRMNKNLLEENYFYFDLKKWNKKIYFEKEKVKYYRNIMNSKGF